ncbi:MAG: hypothetical protein MUQ10_17565, partial [Anaerolineae bacterium]|nr:hypothetical protein [Anaerolineae bacterium]
APWSVIEATDRRYRDVSAARTILNALTARLAAEPRSGVSVSEELFSPGDRQATVLDTVDLSVKTDKDSYTKELNKLQREVHGLARQARDRGLSTVLAFEGWDAAGKGGAIRRITQALEAGDAETAGALLNEAHASARDDYSISCPELEAMVDAALSVEGTLGARLTGAGWGGCIVALVREDAVEAFGKKVAQKYQASTGREATIFDTPASGGAGLVGTFTV